MFVLIRDDILGHEERDQLVENGARACDYGRLHSTGHRVYEMEITERQFEDLRFSGAITGYLFDEPVQELCKSVNRRLESAGVIMSDCFVFPLTHSSIAVSLFGENRTPCAGLASVKLDGTKVVEWRVHMHTHKHTVWKKRETLVDRVSKYVTSFYVTQVQARMERDWEFHINKLVSEVDGLRHYSGHSYRVHGTDVQLDVCPNRIAISSRNFGIYADIEYVPHDTLDIIIKGEVERVVCEVLALNMQLERSKAAIKEICSRYRALPN